ncbi:MAG TPA: hypothetical protein VK132_02900 [Gemmatimonadales bacterium]|nr:hypothetical protein [Gemmatimonadales bacterium]
MAVPPLGRALVLVSLLRAPAAAQQLAPPLLPDVRVFPNDTLRDVAVTVLERGRPTIYYSPTLLAQVGPDLGRFFLAHEYGHIVGGHTGGALGAGDPGFSTARRAQELEADCYAAQRLASTAPADVEAAIRFFTLIGEFRFDDLHPSGSERAARSAACAAILPPATVPASTPVTVMAPANPVSVYGCEAQLWIDRVPVGVVSNIRAAAARLTLPALEPGIRAYTIVLHLYYLDQALQLTPMGTVEATGTVAVAAGDTLMVDWTPGATPTLRTLR